jgi:hypothetical protein
MPQQAQKWSTGRDIFTAAFGAVRGLRSKPIFIPGNSPLRWFGPRPGPDRCGKEKLS